VTTYTKETLAFGSGERWVLTGSIPAAPLFDGQALFGNTAMFSAGQLDGKPTSVNEWLGLTPGTTRYGAGSGQHWGIAGVFQEASAAACEADFAALQAVCGPTATFSFPTRERFAYTDWRTRPRCRIMPGEVVADPNGPQDSGWYWTLAYWCVVRDPEAS
jgi:hypothetical protein